MIIHSAVSFAVNTTETVVEGDTEMMVCVQSTVTPAEAILDKEVVMALSTLDGTGMYRNSGHSFSCVLRIE